MTEKTPNYTAEMVAVLLAGYDPEATQDERTAQIAAISKEIDRPTRSVIAKLTSEGVYVPKVYKTKKGEKVVRKSALVAELASLMGVEEDVISSVEKATKKTLQLFVAALTPETVEADEAEEDAS